MILLLIANTLHPYVQSQAFWQCVCALQRTEQGSHWTVCARFGRLGDMGHCPGHGTAAIGSKQQSIQALQPCQPSAGDPIPAVVMLYSVHAHAHEREFERHRSRGCAHRDTKDVRNCVQVCSTDRWAHAKGACMRHCRCKAQAMSILPGNAFAFAALSCEHACNWQQSHAHIRISKVITASTCQEHVLEPHNSTQTCPVARLSQGMQCCD